MNIKKILGLLLAFILVLGIACGEKEEEKPTPEPTVEEKLEGIINGLVLDTSIKKLANDLVLPLSVNEDYVIKWEIDEKYSEFARIEKVGAQSKIAITQPAEGEEYAKFELKGTISEGLTSVTRTWDDCYVQPQLPATTYTLSDLFDATQGEYVQVSGQVIYVSGVHGYWIEDETGRAYIYVNKEHDIKVGDKLTVKGTKDLYYSLLEVKDVSVVSKEAGEYNYEDHIIEGDVTQLAEVVPASSPYTKEDLAILGKYYHVSGRIVKDPNGKYTYALQDDLSGKSIVLYDSQFAEGTLEKLTSLEGKYVEMIVIFNDFYSSGFGRVIPLVDTIKEAKAPELADDQKVAKTKEELTKLLSEEVKASINLYTTNNFEGVTITWESDKPEVLDNTGKLGTSANVSEEVVLTAVIKAGEVTETVTFNVVVVFVAESTVAEVVKACDGEAKTVVFTGKVVALDQDGYFYVSDATGVIYVRTKLGDVAALGDVVTVTGETAVYTSSNKQYTRQINAVEIKKVEKAVDAMKAVVVSYADFVSYEADEAGVFTDAAIATIKESNVLGKIVTLTGYVQLRGSYGNVYICESEATDSKGILVYYKSNKYDELKAFEGKQITVTLPVYDVHGKDGFRLGTPCEIVEGAVVVEETKIKDVIAAENGTEMEVTGIVAGINAQSFLLSDETGYILVYKGKSWVCDVAVGDEVTVKGKTASYAGAAQFGTDCTYTKGAAKGFVAPEAKVLDGAAITEIAGRESATVEYVTIKGKLVVSGNYFNVEIEGTSNVGSVTYPADSQFVKGFDGKVVEITGFYTGISGGKYFNVLYTEIKEA